MNVILNWGEMPKNCRACHYDMHDTDNARWCVAVSGEFKVICEANQETDKDKRADWCPLLEVKPVQHGQWVEKYGETVCSNCNWIGDPLKMFGRIMWSYCPYCGAKMDGGAE